MGAPGSPPYESPEGRGADRGSGDSIFPNRAQMSSWAYKLPPPLAESPFRCYHPPS